LARSKFLTTPRNLLQSTKLLSKLDDLQKSGGGHLRKEKMGCVCENWSQLLQSDICAMNWSKVLKYFEAFGSLLEKMGLLDKPSQVWNMDETGVQLEHKPHRVLAQKGSKYLHARTSGNRETITAVACMKL